MTKKQSDSDFLRAAKQKLRNRVLANLFTTLLTDSMALITYKLRYTIVSSHRIEPNLTVSTTESGDEVFLPDQETSNFPEDFLVCGQPKPPTFPHASCMRLLFQRGAQRWQVSFGRQFVRDFRNLRTRAKEFIHQFEER
ncbi:hypothetical protein [Rhizobium sp. 007]|uniref:hypothetical protein n=1 Tax=Rhizobium sp. 007 TaxID=2785056 RepID=UPI00188FB04D|nr:hypothetical protein [Rhizobium sp. 007]QPB24289.1 hypothetical protein ISN39_32480 [Rhizobium sp. 007]